MNRIDSHAGLSALIPDGDYRHRMRFERGTILAFFGPTPDGPALLDQRRFWLEADDRECTALLPGGHDLIEETHSLFRAAGVLEMPPEPRQPETSREMLARLGRSIEPDLLWLRPDGAGAFQLVAGCVCFPSSWSLREKIGRPLEWIHDVVPALNPQLGPAINAFLDRMEPGLAWLRSNWGLSRSPDLNQHPGRNVPRLDDTVSADEVWLRIERQALVRLPTTGAVLFGIRIVVHSLVEVIGDPEVRRRLHRALETMPEDMARYKNLGLARSRLLAILGRDETARSSGGQD